MSLSSLEMCVFLSITAFTTGSMLAAGCLYDVLPAPSACTLVPPINNCPVAPNGGNGECRSIAKGIQGFKINHPYSETCWYIEQYRPCSTCDCIKTDPPVTGFYNVQCSRAVGESCKEH